MFETPEMFSSFTLSAKWVLVAAKQEARDLGHPCLGTAHLLLGALRRQALGHEHHALRAGRLIGVDYERTRAEVVRVLGVREPGPAGAFQPTDTTLKVVGAALALRKTRHDELTCTGHLLRGLAHEMTADPPAPTSGLFRRRDRLQGPEFYDIAQRLLIGAAGSLERVRSAVSVGLPHDSARCDEPSSH